MSHEITLRANGTSEMAYVGETPWHGLGQQLQLGAPVEDWVVSAGMDWKIQRAMVRYATAHGQDESEYHKFDEKHVLLRSDTKAPLGIVSDNYKIVQPKAVLEFFRDLTESAGFQLETAGTLFGGRRFWALAATGESAAIADTADRVKGYLLLCTSCDGTMATEARYTDVRVVCNNTLTASRQSGNPKVRVTHRTTFDADSVKKDLGVDAHHERFAKTMDDMRRLADTRLSDTDALMQTARLFNPDAVNMAKKELIKLLDSKPVARVNELAVGRRAIGADMQGVANTQWGWLQGVTEYVDHYARARNTDNRLNSAWFGKGAELKETAYEMALATATGTKIAYRSIAVSDDSSDFTRLLNAK